ncbi:hypothetical protein HOY82DRAFT_111313 [Tuber indicum]|nr:hypothetical protein HOY82DRAFT_111313 [Tuber indicum]
MAYVVMTFFLFSSYHNLFIFLLLFFEKHLAHGHTNDANPASCSSFFPSIEDRFRGCDGSGEVCNTGIISTSTVQYLKIPPQLHNRPTREREKNRLIFGYFLS